MYFKSPRSRLVTVTIPATAAPGLIEFPDQPDLRGCELLGFEVFDDKGLAVAPNGVAVVTATQTVALTVTLADASDKKVREVPYASCIRTTNAGQVRAYQGLVPTWEQCGIGVVSALANVTPLAAVVLVHYRYPNDPR
jgi:hypothetical protein